MGWCSGTEIFDSVVAALVDEEKPDVETTIKQLINALEDGDWDCQQDSAYWGHPLVNKAFKDLHPSWFEDDDL